MKSLLLALVPGALFLSAAVGQTTSRSTWKSFERRDFTLPESQARGTLIFPRKAAPGNPWIWRARFFGHQPALDLALLKRGYHLAYLDVANLYGSQEAMTRGEEFHQHLVRTFSLESKAILEGMSRGGLFIFNFAARHPDKVKAIYGDNPVCDFNSWPGGKNGKASPGDFARCLQAYGITEAEAATYPQISDPEFAQKLKGIPVALVVGTADEVVPPAENAERLAAHLKALNSPVRIWRKPGLGHHPHGLDPVEPLLAFLLESTRPSE
jgi:pimeloyl-ACP methyl ester carboxylesterase